MYKSNNKEGMLLVFLIICSCIGFILTGCLASHVHEAQGANHSIRLHSAFQSSIPG